MGAARTPRRGRVYVDGFNLYYAALKGHTGRKWLDLPAFGRRLLPAGAQLDLVRYFTARISARATDPGAPARQDALLRVFADDPLVAVHEGLFKSGMRRRRLVDPQPTGVKEGQPAGPRRPLAQLGWPTYAWVHHTEEKGSDVNLAVELLNDCLGGHVDVAVIVSDDTDLARPLELARQRGIDVIVASPRGLWLRSLAPNQANLRRVRMKALTACQLPAVVTLKDGSAVHRPKGW
jgi:uncharacterized LabA/DUF88 family protein